MRDGRASERVYPVSSDYGFLGRTTWILAVLALLLLVALVAAVALPAQAQDDLTARALAVNSQVDRPGCAAFQSWGCDFNTRNEERGAKWRHVFEASVAADLVTSAVGYANGAEERGVPGFAGSDGGALALSAALGGVVWLSARLIEHHGYDARWLWALGTVFRVGATANNIYQTAR